jgi:serine/threonine protein kinase
MASRQLGNYRIIDYVGSGGFGSVFKAEDVKSPGRIVALKELHKKHTRSAALKQRFFHEALAMARLDHPNLPRLYTFGEDNGAYYLVMEFVSGIPLSDEIQKNGPLAVDRAVEITRQLLQAVGYAHRNGIIHRDLKPDNIMVLDQNAKLRIKVLDFGIARLVGGENLTMTGEGFGTPNYMSPERITGTAEVDHRTDIYSVGIILFQMLTGKPPFEASSTDPAFFWAEIRRLHQSEPLPSLAPFGVPGAVENIIRKATAKTPEERYSTAEEMMVDLTGGEALSKILLTTAPAAAEVYVDNVPRGRSDEAGRLLVEGLSAGLHGIRVEKPGYNTYKIDLSLEAGVETALQVSLSALSTVAIPPVSATAPDRITEKLAGGDEAKTALLVSDQAGTTVMMTLPPVSETVVARNDPVTRQIDARRSRFLPAAIAVVMFLALAVIAYFVFRGPARPEQQQAVETANENSNTGSTPLVSVDSTPKPPETAANANVPARPQPEEQPDKESEKQGTTVPPPTDTKPESKTETPEQSTPPAENSTQRESCAVVIVATQDNRPLPGIRVLCAEHEPGSSPSVQTGKTGPRGMSQFCGLTAGNRVTISAFGPGRALLGSQEITLRPGKTPVVIRIDRPIIDSDRPGFERLPRRRRPGN